MKRTINVVKYAVAFIALGLFSPSVHVSMNLSDATYEVEYNILQQAEARRGGGGMRAGGMRSGGFSRSRGGFSSSRMRAPSRSRYQGGNFHRSTRPAVSRPTSSRPISSRPASRPAKRPTTRPVNRPGKPGAGKPVKPIRPGNGNRPPHAKPPHGKPPHGGHPPHHRPPHHGHHPHWHHPPHYYPGWGGYWPWFWGSAIVVGAIVSTIPDDDCRDVNIDGKFYKECEGVLFEPVYEGDDVGYKVIKIKK